MAPGKEISFPAAKRMKVEANSEFIPERWCKKPIRARKDVKQSLWLVETDIKNNRYSGDAKDVDRLRKGEE